MADTGRQTVISPEDLGPQSVFVINDLNLVVPPSQITVRKEDLVYRWRTLRTKSATKIPTGHGRVDVHATIYFTSAQLLSLHRLIVQFRHSPFCYVDNRFLRETIVPDWPVHQNMAFTMTGLNITPMPASSDTWIVELDMVWFNYFPYMHNWLYREDWQTNWIYQSGSVDETQFQAYTIGWGLDLETYERQHLSRLISAQAKNYGASEFETAKREGQLGNLSAGLAPDVLHDTWQAVQGGYRDKSKKTIFDMEIAHSGVEWDMVPLPDNMMPAPIVVQPKNSRIYVRYINLLQRDALYKNFGINVEADLLAWDEREEPGNKWHMDAFFGATGEDGRPETYGLHTNRVAKSIRNGWVKKMLDHNQGVKFSFHALKEIQFPDEWVDKASRVKNEAIGAFADSMRRIIDRQNTQANYGPPIGVTGGSELAQPVLGAKFILTSNFGPRVPPVDGASKDHNGIDFGCGRGVPVLSPEFGVVETTSHHPANGNGGGNYVVIKAADGGRWAFMHLDRIDVIRGETVQLGTILGTSGNTGRGSGPHLHLEYSPPGSSTHWGNQINPVEKLQNLLLLTSLPTGVPRILEPQSAESPITSQQALLEQNAAVEEFAEDTEVDEEQAAALSELLSLLEAEGWKYYDRDTTVLNIWEKLITLEIANSGTDILNGGDAPEVFRQQGVVLTNVSGGLQHIVANLPILSSEFPTQQHLGSIEPSYNLEFAVLDDQGNLEGISKMAQFLNGMRSMLQKNARQFRPITDGWAAVTDTFITRLLGSYTENDMLVQKSSGEVVDIKVTKRTVIAASNSGTVEGNPGLSFLMFNIEETNPYEPEALKSTAPQLELKEESRKKILNAILDLDFIDKYKKILLPLLVAQTAGGNTSSAFNDDYGRFSLNTYSPLEIKSPLVHGVNTFILEEDGTQSLMIRKTGGELDYLLDSLSPGVIEVDGRYSRVEIARQNVYDESILSEAITSQRTDSMTAMYEANSNAIGGIAGGNATQLLEAQRAFAQGAIDLAEATVAGIANNPVGAAGRNAVLSTLGRGDGTAEYLKIPLTDAGLVPFLEGSQSWIDERDAETGSTHNRIHYNISSSLLNNPDLGSIPIERLLDYHSGLRSMINTGNRMFAEEQVGGKALSDITNDLYCLPFKSRMWQSWQEYLKTFVAARPASFVSYDGPTAVKKLQEIPGWPTPGSGTSMREQGTSRVIKGWQTPFDVSDPFDAEELEALRALDDEFFGWFGNPIGAATSLADKAWALTGGLVIAGASYNVEAGDIWDNAHREALSRLTNRYMRAMPLAVSLPDWLGEKYSGFVGNLLGDVTDEANKIPVFMGMHEAFNKNADSCGNITALIETGNPWFQVSDNDPFVITRNQAGEVTSLEQDARVQTGGLITANDALFHTTDTVAFAASLGFVDFKEMRAAFAEAGVEGIERLTDIDVMNLVAPTKQIGNKLNSEFQYPVLPSQEDAKVKYLKGLLAQVADDLLLDPEILEVFGLEELALQDRGNNIVGSECYPDLDLPTHPYYGDSFQVYPDFYMWNIYTDGSALGIDDQEKIYEQMDTIVRRCYQSLEQLKVGRDWNSADDKVIAEVSADDPIGLSTAITPEATEGSGVSLSDATELSSAAQEGIKAFDKAYTEDRGAEEAKATTSSKPGDMLPGISMGATEGYYGKGAGVHYPGRIAPGQYAKLQSDVANVQNMFGSQAGHANEYVDEKNFPMLSGRTAGTNLEKPSAYTHSYEEASLKKLARDSAKDLLGQKITLRRAYPTFKLFFVEEDEFDSRFLSFDDFYSYNAVKEFTVVMSRKLPADHAVITLQNVSGTLDGTRRNTIVDLDYFDDTASQKLDQGIGTGVALSGDAVAKDTAQDQPFGAVVLRPGLNVQLRCGYSNDPDNLHVMVTGRVVDVSWNKTGDLAEIMVQSFGTELIQSIKGTARDGSQASYKSTHALLAAMMLEPEVVHFGRWEFGQLFQIGEASDARLDFRDYSREGFLGRFKATGALTSWVVNHPWVTTGLALGFTATQFIPFGRVFGGSAKAAGLLGKAGISTSLGQAGFTKALTRGAAKGVVNNADDVVVAATKAVSLTSNLTQRAASTGNFTANAFISQRTAAYRAALSAAKTVDDVVVESVKYERYLQTQIFKGQWMTKPWMELTAASAWGAVGKKPLGTLFTTFATSGLKIGGAAVAAGLTIDLVLKPIIDSIYNNTVGKAKKFFARTEAHMFLSPQDDNLFPPHPKDYMTLNRSSFDAGLEAALVFGGRVLFSDNDLGNWAYGMINPDAYISKKVDPQACTYEIQTSSIWEIFHEMSLRHPGWIYGPRPYGTKFRYTMFFGVPSQRYWAIPASNRFVHRMNKLHGFIAPSLGNRDSAENFAQTESQFKHLYGADVFEDLRTKITRHVGGEYSEQVSNAPNESVAMQIANDVDTFVDFQMQKNMNSIAMREYLRGLQLRFQPFRRYHLLTSERDIIWNGIMSSEQAVTNAVDVTYWSTPDQDAGEQLGQIQTSIFKAHAFIPEHQLRVAPVRWANCNTYQMAMRYGMGELLHRMRNMYRGELLVLGNPRIRPWDIAILADSYNDMVGPVEVEQVVHSFSHETGFVTEIKPSAVLFGNETSGWPMVEAMKMFAMAIHDIEERHSGAKVENPESAEATGTGFLGSLADLVNRWGARGGNFDSLMDEKYRRVFGDEGASLDKVFGGSPPSSETVDGAIDQAEAIAKGAIAGTGAGMASVGAAVGLAGTVLGGVELGAALSNVTRSQFLDADSNIIPRAKGFLKHPKATVGAAAVIAGLSIGVGTGLVTAAPKMDFPSLAWLVGGPILLLHCLRNESVMLVPLIKNGHPIVSGLSYNDPTMIWNNFRGDLSRWVDDTVGGTRDMVSLYQRYGSALWNRMSDDNLGEMTGEGIGSPTLGG